MPRWLWPAGAGLIACILAVIATQDFASWLGIATSHNISYFDGYGNYHEGGSTRIGFALILVSLVFGGWVGGALHSRRIDCGLQRHEWLMLAVALGMICAYATMMEIAANALYSKIPHILFALLDVLCLGACAYIGVRLYQRLTRA